MHSRFLRGLFTFLAVLACGGAGCSTPVAVSPQGPSQNTIIADYNWGTLTGNISNDVPSAFDATNRALVTLGYFRVGQNVEPETGAMTKAKVYARGIQDVLVTVEMKPAKEEGKTTLSVNLDPEDLPKTQAIYSEILKNLGNAPRSARPAATAPGFAQPSRP